MTVMKRVKTSLDYGLCEFIDEVKRDEIYREVISRLIEKWEEKQIRLAHGIHHVVSVSKKCRDLSRALNFDEREKRDVVVAGLLHEIERPVKKGSKGQEKHGELCAGLAGDVLEDIDYRGEVDGIVEAIKNHDKPAEYNKIGKVLVAADKADVSLLRVFGYAWDHNLDEKGMEGNFRNITDVLEAYREKAFKWKRMIHPLPGYAVIIETIDEVEYILNMFSRQEAQGDLTLDDCFNMFAFYEALLNLLTFKYLGIDTNKICRVMGRYADLIRIYWEKGPMGELGEFYKVLTSISSNPRSR